MAHLRWHTVYMESIKASASDSSVCRDICYVVALIFSARRSVSYLSTEFLLHKLSMSQMYVRVSDQPVLVSSCFACGSMGYGDTFSYYDLAVSYKRHAFFEKKIRPGSCDLHNNYIFACVFFGFVRRNDVYLLKLSLNFSRFFIIY